MESSFYKSHKNSKGLRFGAVSAIFMIAMIGLGGFLVRRLLFSPPREDSTIGESAENQVDERFNIKVEPVSLENLAKPADKPDFKIFTHPKYSFSLEYPRELRVLTFDEGGRAETILFQHPTDKNKGFQIYISPYDGEMPLTAKEIKKIQPFTSIDDPKKISIGGIPAILFWSATNVGQTREVWFAKDDTLYSVTTYAPLDAWLSGIMATWKFE